MESTLTLQEEHRWLDNASAISGSVRLIRTWSARSAIIPLTHVCSEPLDDFAGHAPVHAIPSHPSVGSGGEQAFLGRCINMHMLFIWSRRTGPPSVHSTERWAPIACLLHVQQVSSLATETCLESRVSCDYRC